MMKALGLYIRYALRSFKRGRSRSFFGAFCVAVGVASVVALGLVGGNFTSSVSNSGQKINRGDLSVTPGQSGFTARQYSVFAGLKKQGQIIDYTTLLQPSGQFRKAGSTAKTLLGDVNAVDPHNFPFYDTVTADTPSGKPLSTLLANPSSVVVSHGVFDDLHLHIGSRLTVDSQDGTLAYTVSGIVPETAPGAGSSGWKNPFIMVNRSSLLPYLEKRDIAAGVVYVKTSSAAQATRVKKELEPTLGTLTTTYTTAADALKNSQSSSKMFDTFFRILGLVAVIIGGIGIINNMLVAARRRTKEVAVLKALGMKGRQVVLALTLESLILAIAGTAVGVSLGIGASLEVTNLAAGVTHSTIPWSLHPGALISGVLVGIFATVLFACMPIIQASRSRPVAALRSEAPKLARLGWWRSLLLILGLAASIGYGCILYTGLFSGTQTVVYGAIAGIGALVMAGLLTQVFVLLVWLISKLPSMGRISVRMALRNMGTQKRRLGSTLLALCIGMLVLSTVTILSQNLKAAGQSTLHQLNTNVLVYSTQNPAMVNRVDREIARVPGLSHRDIGAEDSALMLSSVNGTDLNALLRRALKGDAKGNHKFDKSAVSEAVGIATQGIQGHDPRTFSRAYLTMSAGRDLAAQDMGMNHLVVPAKLAEPLGITVGSHLVFSEGKRHVPFTVVGIISRKTFLVFNSTLADLRYMQRMGLTTPDARHSQVASLMISDKFLPSDIKTLQQRLPHAQVVDVSSFGSMINTFVDNLAVFPNILAILCLVAGAVIIANTVALGMIERRHEFGVMKAVGAKRRGILQFLAVEHAIIGFVGAGVGVALAIAAATVLDRSLLYMSTSVDWFTVAGMILLGMGLALGASALTALPASSEKPLRALRYE